MTNADIARILSEMAVLLTVEDVPFKPRAYERAADAIGTLAADLGAEYERGGIGALMEIPGVGRGIAEHIEVLLKGGSFAEYDRLKKKLPVNVTELMAVEGIGPRAVKALWEELGVKDLRGLERAAREHKLRTVPHFGEKSEEKILRGIEFLKKSAGRQPLGFILPDIRALEATIAGFSGVEKVAAAGSVRRRKETIGDIDILVAMKDPEQKIERFVLPDLGIKADLRYVSPQSYGAALLYFTGSKAHNIALREIAIKRGLKLNEYGLWRGERLVAGKTEEEVYAALGLHYIEPELREDTGEIECAREGKLPELVGYDSLLGDLQVHTNRTDGRHTAKEMADAAIEVGLQYIAITDHTASLAMTGGLDERGLLDQKAEIEKLNKRYKLHDTRFVILSGAEVNIMKDGTLDIADETLAQLDVVGAAVHSHFNLSREAQTKRVIRAMENPHVDILFHPTGRIIGKREAIDLDMEAVIAAAKRTGTVLEIDAFPSRSDLRDEYVRKCVEAGVKMVIDTDAHEAVHFRFLEHGISQARRGWANAADILNTLPVDKFLESLK